MTIVMASMLLLLAAILVIDLASLFIVIFFRSQISSTDVSILQNRLKARFWIVLAIPGLLVGTILLGLIHFQGDPHSELTYQTLKRLAPFAMAFSFLVTFLGYLAAGIRLNRVSAKEGFPEKSALHLALGLSAEWAIPLAIGSVLLFLQNERNISPMLLGVYAISIVACQTLVPLLLNISLPTKSVMDHAIGKQVSALAMNQGIKVKDVLIVGLDLDDETDMEGFAISWGLFGRSRKIFISSSTLEKLPMEQSLAVIAHEIGHLKRHDALRILLLDLGLVSVSVLLAQGIRGDEGSVGFIVPLVAYLVVRKIVVAYFRRRFEFGADRFASRCTNPNDLALALTALSDSQVLESQTLWLWWEKATSTHPPIEERLNSLRLLSKEMQKGPTEQGQA